MSQMIEVRVPDIGNFDSVEVIEVLVDHGDPVQPEDSLITIESDKASMEIPCPYAGTVKAMQLKVGERVSKGSLIMLMEVTSANHHSIPQTQAIPAHNQAADLSTQVLVLGAGPGGYTAAFRAADLGKKVILVERYPNLGGVCLNVGCIPSKALLHTAEIIREAATAAQQGVKFPKPTLDLDALRAHKNAVIHQLINGLNALAKQRKVQIVQGYGRFTSAYTLEVTAETGHKQNIQFEQAIIAAGSHITKLPFIPWDDPRILDSSSALELPAIPQHLLVIGGGIIGLEMATIYHALGSKITVVELSTRLIPGADRDLVRPLEKTLKTRYAAIYTDTQVTKIEPSAEGLICHFLGKTAPTQQIFDYVLVATGRAPNGNHLEAGKAGVFVSARGFIHVDEQMRTNVPHIFAIGDIVGQPMLAHKATHEAKVAAEGVAGHKAYFDARTIPSVAYTDPEIAWMGKTEEQCKTEGIEYDKGVFPWAASGRSLSLGRSEGLTKLLFAKDSKQLIGAGIVGAHAGELIAETVLALELGADPSDLSLSIHPHPTLSETINFAAEVALGSCTDIYAPKKN